MPFRLLLNAPLISETRRNHGLEHATLNILSVIYPGKSLGGISDPFGFWIFGDIPTEILRDSAAQALARLQSGESHLAIHPGCGTNYVVSGLLAGLLAWLGMSGARSRRERFARLPLVVVLSTLGFIISQPFGPTVQKDITTSGDPGGLQVVEVYPLLRGTAYVHRVVTRG